METNAKIYIAGHRGMVGSAIARRLETLGYTNIVTRTSKELDLRNQQAVADFFAAEKPDYVFLAAAKVGGINANDVYRGQFIYENLMIELNVIHQAHVHGVKKLLFLGSSCIYPKMAPQPLREDSLLSGILEPTNEPYAIAKIAGIEMCAAYRAQYGSNFLSVMPTNLYGPNDNYDLENSHVLPAMIRKFHEAKVQGKPTVELWGSGTPRREFLHADDLAEACVFLMQNYSLPELKKTNGKYKAPENYLKDEFINIGTGTDVTIKELAEMIKDVVGFEGEIVWNSDKPDGTPRKLMDVSRLHSLGWRHRIELQDGLRMVYDEVKDGVFAKA